MKVVKCASQRQVRLSQQTAAGKRASDTAVEEAGDTGSGEADWLLVLEDDVQLRGEFVALFRTRVQALAAAGHQWDFICVGSRQALDGGGKEGASESERERKGGGGLGGRKRGLGVSVRRVQFCVDD